MPSSKCLQAGFVCQNACDQHPQVCVDWCDAAAYCKAVGKRLCTAYPSWDFKVEMWLKPTNPSELREACQSGTTQSFPYGNTFEPFACNGVEAGHGSTLPVGSLSKCARTHDDGVVFDTAGNVSEWDAVCSTGLDALDYCVTRGGSYQDSQVGCTTLNTGHERSSVAPNLGFRCCGP